MRFLIPVHICAGYFLFVLAGSFSYLSLLCFVLPEAPGTTSPGSGGWGLELIQPEGERMRRSKGEKRKMLGRVLIPRPICRSG